MQETIMDNGSEMAELDSTIFSEAIKKIRQLNIETYKKLELPKEKEKDWRYTNIERLNLKIFEEQLNNKDNKNNTKIQITQLPKNLEEKGVIFCDTNTAFEKYYGILQHYLFKNIKENKDKLTSMNSAFFSNGVFLFVPKHVKVDVTISAIFGYHNSCVIHNIIIAEENSSINFVEEHYCNDEDEQHAINNQNKNNNEKIKNEMLINEITEVFAHDNATVNFHYINKIKNNCYNFANIAGSAERNASINWFSACFGGKINRLRVDTLFNGVGSQSENVGLFFGREKEHIDITTNAYHNTENTTNNIMFDGILQDSSTSVYRGLINIEKQAQKTNSYLSNHILKIGEKTLANSIPALQIEANDVKASHGVTVGQVNEEHLFYLMTRGLARQEAEQMIVQGFLEPVIEKITSVYLKEKIRNILNKQC